MRIIKVILLFVLLFQGCLPVPSFEPEKRMKKKISHNGVVVEWNGLIGNLSQNFPDIITLQSGSRIDTICRAHNIAELLMENELIKIGFYGTPHLFLEKISVPKEISGYTIEVDTSYHRLPKPSS